jgi:hypothetical protein
MEKMILYLATVELALTPSIDGDLSKKKTKGGKRSLLHIMHNLRYLAGATISLSHTEHKFSNHDGLYQHFWPLRPRPRPRRLRLALGKCRDRPIHSS